MAITMCAGSVWENNRSWPCARRGKQEEGGKWWCHQHAPSRVAKRREESNKRYEQRNVEAARQRREAQRAEAVRIVTAYNEWCEDLSAPIDDPNLFAAYLYPEPKEAEGMLLDYATAEADTPVRECPLCPPWFECAHYGDECVRLVNWPLYEAHVNLCSYCVIYYRPGEAGVTSGPLEAAQYTWHACSGWMGRYDTAPRGGRLDHWYDTEAEARAEFERRVAIMLGRDDDAMD